MIGIKTENGVFLDLLPETQLQLRQYNPIFAEAGVIEGTDSIPFDIPMSPDNIEELGHLDIPESTDERNKSIKSTLYFNNTPLMYGTLKLKPSAIGKVQATFLKGMATLGDGFKNTKLSDLISQEIAVPGADVDRFVELQWVGGAAGNFDLGVAGDDFSQPYATSIIATLTALAGLINTAGKVTATAIGPDLLKIEPLDLKDYEASLNIKLNFNPGQSGNWKINSHYITAFNAAYQAWINNYATASPPDDIIRFPLMYNTIIDKEHSKLYPFANFVQIGVFTVNGFGTYTSGTNYLSNANNLAPCVLLSHIIAQIETLGGVTFLGDFIDDAELADLVIYNGATIDFLSNIFDGKPFIHWKHTFNVSDLVPDMTVIEFIKEIYGLLFNQAIVFNDRNNTIKLLFKEGIANDTAYKDITESCGDPNNLEFGGVDGMELRSAPDTGDELYKSGEYNNLADENNPWKAQEFGNKERKITSKFSGIPSGDVANYSWAQVDVALWIHTPRNGKSMRMAFYKGVKTIGSNTYPYAEISSTSYSLSWYGATGLYEMFWKSWARFMQRKLSASLSANLPLRDLVSIDFTKKYRFDRSNYLLRSLVTTLTMRGINASELEIEKI